MGESKVKFGDKIFLYGQFLRNIYDFDSFEYNSIMGMMTVGGYLVEPKETDIVGASIPGLICDFGINEQFTSETPFPSQVEMVDVTQRLSLSPPLLAGCKVWMPTSELPFF